MIYSRRDFIKIVSTFAVSFSSNVIAGNKNKNLKQYNDKAAMDKWMKLWMQSPGAVTGALHLGRFADPTYFLREQIQWTPSPDQGGVTVNVPVGFVTDFASIPRVLWSLLPPDALYTYPAIIHDYLYWEQPVSREEADRIFRYAMEDFKVSMVTVSAIYSGVRLGGEGAWRENTRLKNNGEKRILKTFPTEPTVKWESWKLNPKVFEIT